jgi:hypothetical protein
MPELIRSTREAARRIGVTETALRKAALKGRIEREPDGQWDVGISVAWESRARAVTTRFKPRQLRAGRLKTSRDVVASYKL